MIRRIASFTVVISVRLYYRNIRQTKSNKFLYPRVRKNIRYVRFACMQLDCNLTVDFRVHLFIQLNKMLSVNVFREIYFGFITVSATAFAETFQNV